MKNIPHEKGSGNAFTDLGFNPAATADLTVKRTLTTGAYRQNPKNR